MWDCVQVKEEAAWEGVSAEAAGAGLYAGHEVKQELVVGPDVMQPPDVAFQSKPNFKVTIVKEELNDEDSEDTGAINSDNNQIEKCLKNKCKFSHGGNQLVLRSCTVLLERIIIDEKQRSNNNAKTKNTIVAPELKGIDIDEIYLRKNVVCTQKGVFICDTCGLQFTNRKKIIKHLQTCLKHAPKTIKFKKLTNLLSCKRCNKRFNKRINLIKHEQCHTREKKYNCEVCGKCFYQSSHLYRHKRTHWPEPKLTLKETYLCEICNKQYASKYALVTHLRVHTGQMPYICNCCGKRFNKMSTLVKHVKIHAENRPYYSCEVCKRQFADKWNLTKHKRSHANEYPYSCDLCTKKYMHSYSLTKHKRKKHL